MCVPSGKVPTSKMLSVPAKSSMAICCGLILFPFSITVMSGAKYRLLKLVAADATGTIAHAQTATATQTASSMSRSVRIRRDLPGSAVGCCLRTDRAVADVGAHLQAAAAHLCATVVVAAQHVGRVSACAHEIQSDTLVAAHRVADHRRPLARTDAKSGVVARCVPRHRASETQRDPADAVAVRGVAARHAAEARLNSGAAVVDGVDALDARVPDDGHASTAHSPHGTVEDRAGSGVGVGDDAVSAAKGHALDWGDRWHPSADGRTDDRKSVEVDSHIVGHDPNRRRVLIDGQVTGEPVTARLSDHEREAAAAFHLGLVDFDDAIYGVYRRGCAQRDEGQERPSGDDAAHVQIAVRSHRFRLLVESADVPSADRLTALVYVTGRTQGVTAATNR